MNQRASLPSSGTNFWGGSSAPSSGSNMSLGPMSGTGSMLAKGGPANESHPYLVGGRRATKNLWAMTDSGMMIGQGGPEVRTFPEAGTGIIPHDRLPPRMRMASPVQGRFVGGSVQAAPVLTKSTMPEKVRRRCGNPLQSASYGSP